MDKAKYYGYGYLANKQQLGIWLNSGEKELFVSILAEYAINHPSILVMMPWLITMDVTDGRENIPPIHNLKEICSAINFR